MGIVHNDAIEIKKMFQKKLSRIIAMRHEEMFAYFWEHDFWSGA